MPRPKGSKNKPKNRPPTEGTDVPSRPDTSPPPDAAEAALAVGATVTHPDGRTGEVTAVEPRGSGHAVCVRWAGDEDDSQYTPSDWQEMGATVELVSNSDAGPVRLDDPVVRRSLDDIGHEMAEAQAELDDLEHAKAAIVKNYGKRIGIAAGRVSQLAAEYRQAERREEIDYAEGVVNVYSNRTRDLLATRPLAASAPQLNSGPTRSGRSTPLASSTGAGGARFSSVCRPALARRSSPSPSSAPRLLAATAFSGSCIARSSCSRPLTSCVMPVSRAASSPHGPRARGSPSRSPASRR